MTMSRWERDRVYPTWDFQPRLKKYLGYDPFAQPELGGPKSNETNGVAILTPEARNSFGKMVRKRRLELRKNQTEFAKMLCVDPKTLRHWERSVHSPFAKTMERVSRLLTRL